MRNNQNLYDSNVYYKYIVRKKYKSKEDTNVAEEIEPRAKLVGKMKLKGEIVNDGKMFKEKIQQFERIENMCTGAGL